MSTLFNASDPPPLAHTLAPSPPQDSWSLKFLRIPTREAHLQPRLLSFCNLLTEVSDLSRDLHSIRLARARRLASMTRAPWFMRQAALRHWWSAVKVAFLTGKFTGAGVKERRTHSWTNFHNELEMSREDVWAKIKVQSQKIKLIKALLSKSAWASDWAPVNDD